MFSIHHDRLHGIIRVTLKGFWDASTVQEYQTELTAYVKAAREETGQVLVLCDACNFPVQTSDVVDAFGRPSSEFGLLWDRMAIVITSTLAKMQSARTITNPRTQFFTSVVDAEAWLRKG